jgi:carbon storage regulator
MLVLSRKIGEVITVGSAVKVTVLSFDRGVVRLGIEAPKSIPVHRKEVYDKIIEMNRQAAKTELTALKNAMNGALVRFKDSQNQDLETASLVFTASRTFKPDNETNS